MTAVTLEFLSSTAASNSMCQKALVATLPAKANNNNGVTAEWSAVFGRHDLAFISLDARAVSRRHVEVISRPPNIFIKRIGLGMVSVHPRPDDSSSSALRRLRPDEEYQAQVGDLFDLGSSTGIKLRVVTCITIKAPRIVMCDAATETTGVDSLVNVVAPIPISAALRLDESYPVDGEEQELLAMPLAGGSNRVLPIALPPPQPCDGDDATTQDVTHPSQRQRSTSTGVPTASLPMSVGQGIDDLLGEVDVGLLIALPPSAPTPAISTKLTAGISRSGTTLPRAFVMGPPPSHALAATHTQLAAALQQQYESQAVYFAHDEGLL